MTAVLIALADVGPAVQLEEQLNQAGVKATWDITQADGPRGGNSAAVVLIDADHLGVKLAAISGLWRDQPNVPGVIAIGSSTVAREQAPIARTTLVSPKAKLTTLVGAIHEAAKLRLASDMRWPVLRAAVGLPPVADSPAAWQATLAAARKVDIDIPRNALRWKAMQYATPTARLDELREQRVLIVPELEASKKLDGTRTVQRLVAAGSLDPQSMARFLWALGSMGALQFTPEIADLSTVPRRTLHELRTHLRARAQRLERSTYYDVLELTPLAEYPEIEEAYRLLSVRYAPNVLAEYDLSELQPQVQPMWELIEKARSVLVDHSARGRYHDWLRTKLPELRTIWAIEPGMVQAAAIAFTRGQVALGEGDVHKAMSELAVACRKFPGQPEYEANFAWARCRVQVASGKDRIAAAIAERQHIEDLMLGCRPWPRALVALALLCAASGDADAARWHLHIALQTDPNVPAAAQLAQRLGMRR
ncbi:hypothetical protein BH11MYX3_BH11MYX3_43350 [soil metagenome]